MAQSKFKKNETTTKKTHLYYILLCQIIDIPKDESPNKVLTLSGNQGGYGGGPGGNYGGNRRY